MSTSRFRRYRKRTASLPIEGCLNELPSLPAMGLMVYLASLDDEERISAKDIADRLAGTGRREASAAMATLVAHRFVVKVLFQGSQGRWCTDTLHQDSQFTADDLADIAADYGPGVIVQCWGGDYMVTSDRSLVLKTSDSAALRAASIRPESSPPITPDRGTASGTPEPPAKTPRYRRSRRGTAYRGSVTGTSSSSREELSNESSSLSSSKRRRSPEQGEPATARKTTINPEHQQRSLVDVVVAGTGATREEAETLITPVVDSSRVAAPSRYIAAMIDSGDMALRLHKLRAQCRSNTSTKTPERVMCPAHDQPVPCVPCRGEIRAGDTAPALRLLHRQGPEARPDLASLLQQPDTEVS